MKILISFILLISILDIDAYRSDCKCTGNIRSKFQNEIVGGEYGQRLLPWYAQFKYNVYKDVKSYFCGGVFISEFFVLTAASCLPPPVMQDNPDLIDGFTVSTISGLIQSSKIEKIYTHPNYEGINQTWALNDIAIVKLKERINFRQGYSEPGCFNLKEEDNYDKLLVAGFGHREPVDELDKRFLHYDPYKQYDFRELDVLDQTQKLCSENKDKSICIENFHFGIIPEGICFGDEGTPLHKEKNGKLHIVGINSKVFKYDIDNRYSRYCISGSSATRLSAYKEFIEQHVGDNYCSL